MFFRSSAYGAARFAVFTMVLLLFAGQRTTFAQASAPASAAASQAPAVDSDTSPDGYFTEPQLLSSLIEKINAFGESEGTSKGKNGFYPEFSNMLTGAGWIALGPGYRHYFDNDHVLFDTSAAVSWRLYKMMQMRLERQELANGHLTIGTQAMWQDNTQVNFFGIGPDVTEADQSQYRMQTTDVVGYATVTTKDWLTINGTLGWLGRPKLMNPGGTFQGNYPSTLQAFPSAPAADLSQQPQFAHSEASIVADTRDHRGHPTRGGMYRAALTNYWDTDGGFFTFHTWEAEGLQYVPLDDSRIVLAFHGWTVFNNPSNEHEIPFYLLPAMGGNRTNRDFHDFEFHDNNLVVLQAESRFSLWTHVDAALFVDAGNVARHYGDLNLGQRSYGAGLRLHNERTTLLRADLAQGEQGWHAILTTTEPFRLPRVRRLTAIVPFFP